MHPSRIAITVLLALALCVGAALQDRPHAAENGISQVSISCLGNGLATAEAKVHTQENHQKNSTDRQYHAYTPDDDKDEDGSSNLLINILIFIGIIIAIPFVISAFYFLGSWIWKKIRVAWKRHQYAHYLKLHGLDKDSSWKD